MTGATEKYFLRTGRLGFRNWTKDDLDLARELWGDLEVMKFFGGPFSEEEIRKRFKREMARRLVHGFQYWVIELLEGGEFVGICGIGDGDSVLHAGKRRAGDRVRTIWAVCLRG